MSYKTNLLLIKGLFRCINLVDHAQHAVAFKETEGIGLRSNAVPTKLKDVAEFLSQTEELLNHGYCVE